MLLYLKTNFQLYFFCSQMESTRCGDCSSLCPRHRPRRNEIGLDAHQPDHHESDEGIKNCKRYEICIYNDVIKILTYLHAEVSLKWPLRIALVIFGSSCIRYHIRGHCRPGVY